MTNIFVIYEAAMCCSSGVCGPSPDQSLLELQDTLDKIRKMGAVVDRYSITGNPKKFRENQEVVKLIQEHQVKALPITTYNGKVFKVAGYPSFDEFKSRLNTLVKGQIAIHLEPSTEGGCCSGQNSCDRLK